MITDRQTRLLRQKRMEGKTQETAAAKAGMSVRSARKWQSGPLPSQAKPEHRWRTRPDPFDGVWEDEIEPLLRNDPTGKLKATTIIALPHSKRYPTKMVASPKMLPKIRRQPREWRHKQDGEARAGQSRLILVRGKIPGSPSSGSLTSPENGQLQHKGRKFQRVGGLSITFKPQTRANVISV